MDIVKTLNRLIEDVNNGDVDTLAELQRELIYLKSELEQLNIGGVSQQRELLLAYESHCRKKTGLATHDSDTLMVEDFLAKNCG